MTKALNFALLILHGMSLPSNYNTVPMKIEVLKDYT